jgi:hypothetical protein
LGEVGVMVAVITNWAPYLIASLVMSVGAGFWCMRVYQAANERGWEGFLYGFVMTMVLNIFGAAVAVYMAYRVKAESAKKAEGEGPVSQGGE